MKGMVVAPQPEAAEVGIDVLERGGNAVDAAIACAFVQGVVDPQMTGIGGFGAMQLFMREPREHCVLEFYARAPFAARDDMWADLLLGQTDDGFKFILDGNANDAGFQAVATPGNLKGYADALERFGTMDLRDVMAPAIGYARDGFTVRPYVHYHWALGASDGSVSLADKLAMTETGRRIYLHPDGSLKKPGDRVVNEDLARTLTRIAQDGVETFYNGEIAEEIAADMAQQGGLLRLEDLERYSVITTNPVWGSYRGYEVASLGAPGGGLTLIQLLQTLEHFDLSALPHNGVEHIRLLVEAMRRATRDRDHYVGDPQSVDVPAQWLLSKDYARECAESIRRGERASIERVARNVEPNTPDTTHVSVVDRQGNAVTLTHTLGTPSGAITRNLGFMYNGAMGAFDPRPGRALSIGPGKRRASAMSPTIVMKDGLPFIVTGAPGGNHIVPAIAQGIMNVIDYGMSMFEAVAAPRVAGVGKMVEVSNRVRRSVTAELESLGYPVKRSYQSYAFAALHAIHIDGDRVAGGADPQRDGMALATKS